MIDLRTLKPLDLDAILGSIAKTNRAVIVHEAHRFCGFGADLAATIQEAIFSERPTSTPAGWWGMRTRTCVWP